MFTHADAARVRWYLGYPDRFHSVDTALEQAMASVKAEAEQLILAQLADLDTIKDQILDARKRAKAQGVGTITLDAFREVQTLRSIGRQLVGQVAAALSCTVRHDVFSSTSPPAGTAASDWYNRGPGDRVPF